MIITEETSIKRPGRLLRILFRLPLIFYRIGMGSLMGMQILLSTVGRKSGKYHNVVVDVIGHDKAKNIYYISAAFGPRSDWYLNLRAVPIVKAQVGRQKFTVRTTTLPLEEAQNMLVKFARHHPHYVRIMMRVIGVKIGWSEEDLRALALQMPIVACMQILEKKE